MAARQWGVVARRQLVASGVGRGAIDRALRSGRLVRMYPGVYAVGHAQLRREGRWLAAVFACGDRAVLSHRSAAALWDILGTNRADVDVTAPKGPHSRPGIAVHRVRRLHPDDVTVRRGIPVTTVARTLLDVAEVERAVRLERAVAEADVQRLLDHHELERTTARAPGRRGRAPLAALMSRHQPPQRTESELEERFLQLVDDHHLPRPETQQKIGAWRVDFLWSERRLIAETDGARFHATPHAQARDRRKATALTLAGYRTLRFGWDDVTDRPGEVIAKIAHALA